MNHIITYNEAIRWYKNGKLEPYEDIEEPIVEKDLFVFNYMGNYYIAYYDDKYIFDNGYCFIGEGFIFESKLRINSLKVAIPDKITNDKLITLYIRNDKGKDEQKNSYFRDLPQNIKDRIIGY